MRSITSIKERNDTFFVLVVEDLEDPKELIQGKKQKLTDKP